MDEAVCTGCQHCALDYPYDAIAMVERPGGRSPLVARVDPSRCVSCGICAASCAPMGVGPPGRTGRHQLDQVRALLDGPELEPGGVVALLCARGAGILGPGLKVAGAVVCEVDCTGSLHTSAIEFLVRGGFAGVIVFACPPRDCANREGAKWLEAWMYHDREAELRARVDRRRVALAFVGAGERRESVRALREFQAAVAALDRPVAEVGLEADAVCEAAAEEVVEA